MPLIVLLVLILLASPTFAVVKKCDIGSKKGAATFFSNMLKGKISDQYQKALDIRSAPTREARAAREALVYNRVAGDARYVRFKPDPKTVGKEADEYFKGEITGRGPDGEIFVDVKYKNGKSETLVLSPDEAKSLEVSAEAKAEVWGRQKMIDHEYMLELGRREAYNESNRYVSFDIDGKEGTQMLGKVVEARRSGEIDAIEFFDERGRIIRRELTQEELETARFGTNLARDYRYQQVKNWELGKRVTDGEAEFRRAYLKMDFNDSNQFIRVTRNGKDVSVRMVSNKGEVFSEMLNERGEVQRVLLRDSELATARVDDLARKEFAAQARAEEEARERTLRRMEESRAEQAKTQQVRQEQERVATQQARVQEQRSTFYTNLRKYPDDQDHLYRRYGIDDNTLVNNHALTPEQLVDQAIERAKRETSPSAYPDLEEAIVLRNQEILLSNMKEWREQAVNQIERVRKVSGVASPYQRRTKRLASEATLDESEALNRLGIAKGTSEKEAKLAYRRLMQTLNPNNSNNAILPQSMKEVIGRMSNEINGAWSYLANRYGWRVRGS